MKTLLAASAGLALATAGSMAFADDGDRDGRGYGMRHGGMMMRMLDTDMDRSISQDEYLNPTGQRFANADKNSDGQIDASEIDALLAARLEEMRSRFLERFDGDSNGSISKDEFEKPARERFSMLDRDDNGSLDRDDMRRHGSRGEWRRDGRGRGERRHWRRRDND